MTSSRELKYVFDTLRVFCRHGQKNGGTFCFIHSHLYPLLKNLLHIPQEYFTNKRQFVSSQASAMSVFTCRKGSNMRM